MHACEPAQFHDEDEAEDWRFPSSARFPILVTFKPIIDTFHAQFLRASTSLLEGDLGPDGRNDLRVEMSHKIERR